MGISRKESQKIGAASEYSVGAERIEEGMLDDPRLQVLVMILGMPKDATRVRIIWSGTQVRNNLREYEVEFFGIKVDPPIDPNLVDCIIHYGEDELAHVWLFRVRWKNTKAVYEGIWLPGDDSGSWAFSIRDLHLVEKGLRKRDCARLLAGSDLATKPFGIKKPGRKKGTGLFKSKEDFQVALWDVFSKFSRKPSEPEVIELLRQHSLCQQNKSGANLGNQTRTLRDWIKKAEFKDFHDAWRKYLLSPKSGK